VDQTDKFPNGIIFSGGQDKKVLGFEPTNAKLLFSLEGHTNNVCTLSAAHNLIISGSWDKTAKVWQDGKCLFTLKAHEAAVWGAICTQIDAFATAGADRKIILWNKDNPLRVINAHDDVVRSLVSVQDIGFISCSNDASLKLWTLSGDLIDDLHGHTSFVYSIDCLNAGYVSSGEDRTVRIWNGFIIVYPRRSS
jgi:phospholipase A-2-activating protein